MIKLDAKETLSIKLEPRDTIRIKLTDKEQLKCKLTVPNVPSQTLYPGEMVITPSAKEQKLGTKHRYVTDDIVVLEIPTYEVSNEKGTSFIIAS